MCVLKSQNEKRCLGEINPLVLVIYCYITNDHKLSSLKQYPESGHGSAALCLGSHRAAGKVLIGPCTNVEA